MYSATLTQKGQVTIPQPLRQLLGLKSGDNVSFLAQNNEVILKPAPSLWDLEASVRPAKKSQVLTVDQALDRFRKQLYVEKQQRS